jgi:methylated-DNA-protein-cysteine methyltransferase related protein
MKLKVVEAIDNLCSTLSILNPSCLRLAPRLAPSKQLFTDREIDNELTRIGGFCFVRVSSISTRSRSDLMNAKMGYKLNLSSDRQMTERPSTYQRIYDVVRKIPIGKVVTYGQVAELAGLYGKARLVGYALFKVEIASDIPWQRVVNIKGEISHSIARCGGDYLQRNLLVSEGIEFIENTDRIDMTKYRWQAPIDLMDE